jgi:hypothetical protein
MEMRVEIKMEVWRASGCRHFLRGPSGAIGSSSTSKQVSKYSRSKSKNPKPIAVDVLLQAYPELPLSCKSNLAGRYLKVN